MKKIRLGIIGANWSLVGHLPAWRELPGIEIVAICTSRQETAEAAAKAYGIPRAFWNWQEMIADPDIDLVDVGTQPRLRQEIVLAAMRAGKHIYNCNPFTTDMAKARETIAVQREMGTAAAVDAQFVWIPQFRHMKKLIDEGYIGDLYNVAVRSQFPLLGDGSLLYPFTARASFGAPYYWLGDSASGASALRNLGGHSLHLLRFLFGPVSSVVADQATNLKRWHFGDREDIVPDTTDTANMLLRFAGGGMGQLTVGWSVADARGYEIEVYGSKGRLRAFAPAGFPDTVNTTLVGAQVSLRGVEDLQEREIALPEEFRSIAGMGVHADDPRPLIFAMTGLFNALAHGIRDGTPVEPGFPEAFHVQQIVEAADRSVVERRWIDISEV